MSWDCDPCQESGDCNACHGAENGCPLCNWTGICVQCEGTGIDPIQVRAYDEYGPLDNA